MSTGLERWLVVVAIAAAVIAAVVFLPLSRWVLALVELARGAGLWGALLYAAVYVVATVLLVPGSVLTIGAGFLYGTLGGVALVWPSALLGATAAFVIGRFAARGWVRERVSRYPRLRAVDDAIGERSFGVVVLLRLSPLVPFALLNYFLALTRARLGAYVIASGIGMLPGTLLYVYLGSLVTRVAALSEGERPDTGAWGQVVFWGGLAATAAVTVWVTRLARARLAERVDGVE